MRCDEVAIELDAYLTGELDSTMSAEIEQHLNPCSACRGALLMVQKENALYQDYRSTVETPTGAWKEIQERIDLRRGRQLKSVRQANPSTVFERIRSGGWWVWAAAASVLLVAGVALHFYGERNRPQLGGPGGAEKPAELPPPIDQAVNDLKQALAPLQAAYTKKKPDLDPKLVRELDRNLTVTRTAIDECERALKEDPNNRQAVEFLLLGYEKQIDILKQITEEL